MGCFDKAVRLAGALAFACALASCSDLPDFENMFNQKKPLPGERKLVFPEGVPGVPQGIPQELTRGYQPPQAPETQAPTEQAEQTPVQPEPPKPKPKPKAKTVAAPPRPPTAITVQRPASSSAGAAAQSGSAAPAAGGQAQQQQQQSQQTGAWPQGTAPTAPTPWPSPPPAGTFSR
jgi:outer membrane biosynthesis protein TonB